MVEGTAQSWHGDTGGPTAETPPPALPWASTPGATVLVVGPGYRAVHPRDPVRDARIGLPRVRQVDMEHVEGITGPHGELQWLLEGETVTLQGFRFDIAFGMSSYLAGYGLFRHRGEWWYARTHDDDRYCDDPDYVPPNVYARRATAEEVENRNGVVPDFLMEGSRAASAVTGGSVTGAFAIIEESMRLPEGPAYEHLLELCSMWESGGSEAAWERSAILARFHAAGHTLSDLLASLGESVAELASDQLGGEAPEDEEERQERFVVEHLIQDRQPGTATPCLVEFFDQQRHLTFDVLGLDWRNEPGRWAKCLWAARAEGGTVLDLVHASAVEQRFPTQGRFDNLLLRWDVELIGSSYGGESWIGHICGRHDIADEGNDIFLIDGDPALDGLLMQVRDGQAGFHDCKVTRTPSPLAPDEIRLGMSLAAFEQGTLYGAIKLAGGSYSRFLVIGKDAAGIVANNPSGTQA